MFAVEPDSILKIKSAKIEPKLQIELIKQVAYMKSSKLLKRNTGRIRFMQLCHLYEKVIILLLSKIVRVIQIKEIKYHVYYCYSLRIH
jgi:hypothetical protein